MKVIGRIDKVDIPLLNLQNLDVKIDTGAHSCSIHCHDIELIEDGKKVRFFLLDPAHKEYNEKEFILPVQRMTKVKSSTGHSQKRVFIKTQIVLFGKKYEAEISLANRKKMKFPMLLGSSFLRGKFLVDVSQKNLSYKAKK
jgi:hypothetical protein